MKIDKLKSLSAGFLLSISLLAFGWSHEGDWQLVKSENGISVYAKVETCGPGSWYIFKIENNLNEPMAISYEITVRESVTFGPAKGELNLAGKDYATGSCEDVYRFSLPCEKEEKRSPAELIDVQIIKK